VVAQENGGSRQCAIESRPGERIFHVKGIVSHSIVSHSIDKKDQEQAKLYAGDSSGTLAPCPGGELFANQTDYFGNPFLT
jgi:hypothetical protein